MLDAAEAARRGGGLAGTLRVTLVPSFGQAVLGPRLAQFQGLHPELRLELRFTHRRVDLVREDIDVAFRLTSRSPADCIAIPVLPFTVHAYAAAGAGALAGPQVLATQRCLVFGTPTDELTMTWIHQCVKFQ